MTSSSSDSEVDNPRLGRPLAAIFLQRAGELKRKGTWGSWTDYYYCLENCLLLEFKNSKSSIPRKVYRLNQYGIKVAESLTGDAFTFGLFSVSVVRNPTYFQAKSKNELIHWVSAIQSFCDHTEKLVWEEDLFIEALNDGVVTASEIGIITNINAAFTKIYGWERDALIGKNLTILMESQHAFHHDSYVKKFTETGHGSFVGTARRYNTRNASGVFIPSEISLGQMGSASFLARFRVVLSLDDVTPGHQDSPSSGSPLIRSIHDVLHKASSRIQTTAVDEIGSLIQQLDQERNKVQRLEKRVHELRKIHKQKEKTKNPISPASSSTASSSQDEAFIDIVIDTSQISIDQRLTSTGGSGAGIFLAIVDGWQCVCKELIFSELENHRLFEIEIATLESLPPHRNLVRYLFHLKSSHRYQLFMSRYDTNLSQIIRDRKSNDSSFSLVEITKFLLDIVQGVSVLHQHEIIHRDLKPENIFVKFSCDLEVSRLVLGDFDSAKRVSIDGPAKTIIGTPGYMAPEILTEMRYGFSVDVWSIGTLIYELVTLKRLFEDKSFGIHEFLSKRALPPLDRSRLLPQFTPLLELLEKCLQFEPLSRPSIFEISQTLLQILVLNN